MNTVEGLSALGELGGIGRGHVAIEFWEVSAGTLDVLNPEKLLCATRRSSSRRFLPSVERFGAVEFGLGNLPCELAKIVVIGKGPQRVTMS